MTSRYQGKTLKQALQRQSLLEGDEVVERFMTCVKVMTFNEGDKLITENDSSCELYLILAGEVEVTIKSRHIAHRKENQHVGEMTLIDPGACRSADVTATMQTTVAVITEEDFSNIADQHPSLWRNLALELSKRLHQRSKQLRTPNDKPVVFIGSSSEKLLYAQALQRALDEHTDIKVNLWSDPGRFEESSYPLLSLKEAVESADFAIMVVADDDITRSRKTQSKSPRDNVIFELGLFMGNMDIKRVFILQPKGTQIKIPSDLTGITPLYYDPDKDEVSHAVRNASYDIHRKIRNLGPR